MCQILNLGDISQTREQLFELLLRSNIRIFQEEEEKEKEKNNNDDDDDDKQKQQ